MNVQISVVIPTYKRPKLLLKCLNALSAQSLGRNNYEVIVISDGPDQLTEQALAEFSHRKMKILYAATPFKKGPAAARNYGWLAAHGDLIVFTDDDCIPDKNWLSAYYSVYQLNKNSAFTGRTIVPLSPKPTDYERNTAGLATADFITANCACPKSILITTGGFDEKFAMAWREDSDLEFKLINLNIPINKVHDAVITHPVRQAPWGVSIKEQKKTMYNALLYKKYPALYRKKIQPTPPVLYYAILGFFLLALLGLISHINLLFYVGIGIWLGLSLFFAYRRLKQTTWRFSHFFEMVATSAVIPFLSLYWQFYGAIKYRKLLL